MNTNSSTQLPYLIGLTLIEGIGPVLAKRLAAYCGSPAEVFNEKKQSLAKVPGIGDYLARIIGKSHHVLDQANRELEFCRANKIKVVSYLDEAYPGRLRFCEDGPVVLYLQGQADLNPGRIINIVGTRNPSDYGKHFTENLVEAFAPYSPTIVSGMAYGIDIVTHRSCLKHGIPTIGVMAHGIDMIYPQAHSNIANKILREQGCIMTEFMSGSGPDKENFPKRNRIVAGMCDVTIVIETGIKGGSMITARLANDYNRDVFALPGSPGNEKASGCNLLIKTHRAALFESAEDIARFMSWDLPQKTKTAPQSQLFQDLNEDEKMITDLLLQKGKLMVDSISLNLSQPVSKVSVTLLNLEFKGAIRALPGKLYELA